MSLPAPKELRAKLRYDPELGRLYWCERGVQTFKTGHLSAQQYCDIWNRRYANKEAFTAVGSHGYKVGRLGGKTLLAHRVAFAIYHGKWPASQVDHIDRDQGNNSINNLREATASGNAQNVNSSRTSSSQYLGVRLTACGTYQARIKSRDLGTFKSEIAAAEAYDLAAKTEYGEFANCNFKHEETQ